MTFTPLKSNALQNGGGIARFEWFAVIPNDTLVEDILKPGWWVHWASALKPMQRVELVSEDFLLDLDLRVIKVDNNLVWVKPLRITEDRAAGAGLAEARAAIADKKAVDDKADLPDNLKDEYKVGFAPGNNLYYVTLKATKVTIKTGFKTKPDAIAFAVEHSKQALAA